MSEWISVDERLPEQGQMVITYSGIWNLEQSPHPLARMMSKDPTKWFEDPDMSFWKPAGDPPQKADQIHEETKRPGHEL